MTFDDALYHLRSGLMSEAEWRAYAHAWQTGASRFEILACGCASCRAAYPELRPLATGVAVDWGTT